MVLAREHYARERFVNLWSTSNGLLGTSLHLETSSDGRLDAAVLERRVINSAQPWYLI